MAGKVLVVEDEPQIVEVICAYLERAGFEVTVAGTGPAGLEEAIRMRPDAIILDLMLPELDGLDVARALRRHEDPAVAHVPILMLTARAEEVDKLVGLEVGADDYVSKPFSPREVVARIRALVRRSRFAAAPATAGPNRFGQVTVDRARHQVAVGSKRVNLTPTEFEILAALVEAPGRVFSRMDLLALASGDPFEGYERTIDVHIKNLRAKLAASGVDAGIVETVRGYGYRLARERAQN